MAIGSAGHGRPGDGKEGAAKDDAAKQLRVMNDINAFHQFYSKWNNINQWTPYITGPGTGSATECRDAIKAFIDHCNAQTPPWDPIIYYTGHGERGTGDWCFGDGSRFTFATMSAIYPKRIPVVLSDCCFSGQWAWKAQKSSSNWRHVIAASDAGLKAKDGVFADAVFKEQAGARSRLQEAKAICTTSGAETREVKWFKGQMDNAFNPRL